MAIVSSKQLVEAELNGQTRRYWWRKVPTQSSLSGVWGDLSMSPGNPKAKLWFDNTPLKATQVSQSTDYGIYHGDNVSPSTKYLRKLTLTTTNVSVNNTNLLLCDYLLYYPTIDDAESDSQVMDNTSTLPRYTDGEGVQMVAVTLAARTGGQTFSVSYTNQSGVSGRTSQTVSQGTSNWIGSVVTSSPTTLNSANPFIPLQRGDTGVRSVESVTMNGPDTGLFAIILVKPIATFYIKDFTVPFEKDFMLHGSQLPIIKDDAYLSFLHCGANTLSGQIINGDLQVVFN